MRPVSVSQLCLPSTSKTKHKRLPVLVLRVRGFRKELENTDLIVKIVNTTQNPQEADFVFDGIKLKPYSGNSECISSTNLDAVNSFSNPLALKPISEKCLL